MKKQIIISTLSLCILLLIGCQTSDYKEVNSYTIDQFMNTTSIFGSSFSSDEETILLTSDESGIFNVYMVSVKGNELKQITKSDSNSIFGNTFFPNDKRILFMSDQGGNEIYHLYLLNEDGSVQDLTPNGNSRSLFYGWSFDEQSFYFTSNKRDPRFMDLYEMDIETMQANMIYQNDEGYNISDISNDKRFLAFNKPITNHNSDMYLYDLKKKEIKHLSPHEGDINYSPVTFSVGSKSLYY